MNRSTFIEHIKKLFDWILLGLLVFGIIILYGVSRANNLNVYFLGVGIISIGIPALVLWLRYRQEIKETDDTLKQELNRLKKFGYQIEVDLTQCEVRSNSWITEEERYTMPRIQMWNAIGGDSELNVKQVNHQVTEISCMTKLNGICYKFAGSVHKDEHTVKMLLETKIKTIVYVDKSDSENYYFDLKFLEN